MLIKAIVRGLLSHHRYMRCAGLCMCVPPTIYGCAGLCCAGMCFEAAVVLQRNEAIARVKNREPEIY